MSVRVVDCFEVIEVNEQHAELITKTRRTIDLSLKRLIKMTRVIEASAVVGDSQFLNFFDGARVLDGNCRVVTQRLQKESFLIGEVVEMNVNQLDHAQHAQLGT